MPIWSEPSSDPTTLLPPVGRGRLTSSRLVSDLCLELELGSLPRSVILEALRLWSDLRLSAAAESLVSDSRNDLVVESSVLY